MELSEAHFMIDYFLKADHGFLSGLGVDPAKMPPFDRWHAILAEDFARPLPERRFFYVVWQLDGVPIGHSNINEIVFGKKAFMHLHIWNPDERMAGHGTYFIRESIKLYFKLFELQQLFCQPYALNQAPNRTLQRIGFKFLKSYETTPGWLNFRQPVNLWVLDRSQLSSLSL